jgi:cysteine desulfurase/selenocysteine lyase
MTTLAAPPRTEAFSDAELVAIRADFPVLARTVGDGVRLVYLDSAATSQRPRQVLDAERAYVQTSNAAVHRGAHSLAEEATDAYESAREAVAAFVGSDPAGVVWTRNATEGLNLLAHALSDPDAGELALRPGDEVVVTELEHHANLVPWQRACARSGARLRWLPLTDAGRLDLDAVHEVVGPRCRVLAFAHASNVLGSVNPVELLIARAREVGALSVLDACQSVPHRPVDLAGLGVDAAVFSGHKMLGPTGIGVLAARPGLLDALPPFLTGGSMVETVTMESATYRPAPQRFEAGTPPVSQAVALHAAVGYLQGLGMARVKAHEHVMTARLLAGLDGMPGVRVIGPAEPEDRVGAVSVDVDGVHAHDVGQVLDAAGIAVRVGHHCAQPVHRRYGITATTRASVQLYTTPEEVDAFLAALAGVRGYFGVG